jgi:LemA protein
MLNIILLIVLGVILFWAYGIYVTLIQKKNKVSESFSGIDIQLKKRSDLIPNILAIAKKFMTHEATLLEDITKLRTQQQTANHNPDADIKEKLNIENQLSTKMSSLMVSVENYPDLKSDQTMIQAQRTYSEVEEQISASRRFYNSAVNELNNAVEIFPSSFIAGLLGIKTQPLFEATQAEKTVPNAADLLN